MSCWPSCCIRSKGSKVKGFQTPAWIEKFLFYRPGEVDMILSDLHSIISVPPPDDGVTELRLFHASLPDFLLDRSRTKDFFLDQGAGYARLTGLALKHINNLTESPMRNLQCMSFPCCRDFCHSMKMKSSFIMHSGLVVSKLVHPQSSLRTCAS